MFTSLGGNQQGSSFPRILKKREVFYLFVPAFLKDDLMKQQFMLSVWKEGVGEASWISRQLRMP